MERFVIFSRCAGQYVSLTAGSNFKSSDTLGDHSLVDFGDVSLSVTSAAVVTIRFCCGGRHIKFCK